MKLHLRYSLVCAVVAWMLIGLASRRTLLRIPNTQSKYCRPAALLRGWLTAIPTCRDTGSPMARVRERRAASESILLPFHI